MTKDCSDSLLTQIQHEIEHQSPNLHKYPITIGQHAGKWSVVLEIDSNAGTFDIEIEEASLPQALSKALGALRRAYSPVNTKKRELAVT